MRIDVQKLKELDSHNKKLGLKRILKGISYERCAELPYILTKIEPYFEIPLTYLDIGSGNSILPSFLLSKSKWDIHCVDKFKSVNKQLTYARRSYKCSNRISRFHIIEKDFMKTELQNESFDIITNISVIEHFAENSDSEAIKKSSELLKTGGLYILTTLINDGHYREFYLKKSVYGVKFNSVPVFYQRHYDVKQLEERIIKPSGLKEIERIYFGEYDYQFFNKFLKVPWLFKPIKLLYHWATPFFAQRYITYRNYPVSNPKMDIVTVSGIIIVLKKE
jgi:hypothetical protein